MALALLLSVVSFGAAPAWSASGTTSRVSGDSAGGEGNGSSSRPATRADGRYVAFHSDASNLVSADTNGASDGFVQDRHTGATSRVSVDSPGAQADAGSHTPSISADGRLAAFQSSASNLVAGDTNGAYDVFVRDFSDNTAPAAPTVALTDPVNAANQSAVTVSGTGEAGTTADVSVDDEDSATAPVTATAAVSESGYSVTLDLSSLSDGTLTVTVTLTDVAGNTGPAGTTTATKDTVAPVALTVALTDPVHPANQASVTVSRTGEAGTTANVSVDDEDPATAAVTSTARCRAPVTRPPSTCPASPTGR